MTRQPGVGVRIATTCHNGATYLVDAVGAALRTTQWIEPPGLDDHQIGMEAHAEIGGTDLDLVERARLRDEDAFADLVRPRLAPLLRLASAITGDEIDARDALQEALTSAWAQLPSLRDAERFDAWLTRILINACRLVLRRRRRRVREIRLEPSFAADEAESMTTVLDRLALDRAFERLGTDERAILALHHLEERPLGEIAGLLGIPLGTVKSRLYAARVALARELRKEQP